MARLMPNPIGELAEPLQRMERSLVEVERRLEPLSSIATDMAATRAAVEALVTELGGLRAELRAAREGGSGR